MKNTIFLILLLAASASAQSLTETLNFLNDKMADHATFQVTKGRVVNVEPVNFSGCTVSWIESYTLTGEQAPVTSLKAGEIEPVVWSKLVEIIESADAVASMRERYTARDGSKQTLIDEVKRLGREITKVEGAISLITQRAGTATDAVWDVLQVELGKQQNILNGLRTQRDTKNQAIQLWDDEALDFDRLAEYINAVRPQLAQMEFQERRRVIDALDVRAIWNKGRVSISMSILPSYSQTKLELVCDNSKRVELA